MSQFAHGISSFDGFNVTNFDQEKPVWLLGQSFNKEQMEKYRQAFESILWFTYRRDFDRMEPYEYTSDAGWGCMLRSAQMMLSQAFKRRLLGPTWTVPLTQLDQLPQEYVQILKWFVDSPHPDHVYSIHNMVKIGMQYDKLPGEWYGPTTAAQVLRDLVNLHSREYGGVLSMYVPQEGVVYSDDVRKLCVSHVNSNSPKASSGKEEKDSDGILFDPLLNPPTNDQEKEWSTSLLVLIPLRLGLDKLNEAYLPALTKIFEFPQSVGIIGGKRGHSVYFVGTTGQGNKLQLLDPHDVHPTTNINASFPTATHLRTVHSSNPLVMSCESIDPSLALGFLCIDRRDYKDFCERVKSLQKEFTVHCPFSVADRRPDYTSATSDLDLMMECLSTGGGDDGSMSHGSGSGFFDTTGGIGGGGEEDEEEYVMI